MRNDELVIAIALVFAVIVLTAVKIIEFFVRFNNDTRYITREMQRADDYNTYRRWRGELRCHYLCLIPFVNDKNVMRLYRRIYHKPKHENTEKRSDGLYHILAPSIIGIFICAVCLCGASWAWFTSIQTSSVANIQTAMYSVTVTATKDGTDITVNENNGNSDISLEAKNEYTITVNADGNAKSGYCKVEFGETVYYTPQITPNNTFVFKVKAKSDGSLKITPQWGTCSATENIIESVTTLELGTISVSDNNEPENNNATATPQITPATPENTKPTVDNAIEATAPADTDEQPNNNISDPKQEQEKEPEETTEANPENE